MKIFSAGGRAKRSTAVNCLIINQFATPGLGSLMARHFIAGSIQLALSLVGFSFVIGWFIQTGFKLYRELNELPPEPARYPWLGWAGAVIFLAAWLLAWITTISVFRESRKTDAKKALGKPVPPII